ncbi:MAG: NAD(P)H-binding protein [Roseinatronobacter sp.]|nr:NAD(P)H-binding protein [Roseinatronobacter sp.]
MNETTRPVLLLGATGTIGRAVLRELQMQGKAVICLLRKGSTPPQNAPHICVDFSDPAAIADALRASGAGAVLSCMASRSGRPQDAWAVDHAAHSHVLRAAIATGVTEFILLSAICVQKPDLEFQRAKLAFEAELQAAPLIWSIVRPTAFFKSLSGQVARVQAGKPFLLFGDGTLTACTPISDRDLARYLVGCLDNDQRQCRILPIGGPGPALTPRAQGEMLFALLDKPPRFRHVPVGLMDAIIALLGTLGRFSHSLAEKAEFARIGRYYATESMLVWDGQAGRYDASATPAFGTDTLRDHYAALIQGTATADLGEHAMF